MHDCNTYITNNQVLQNFSVPQRKEKRTAWVTFLLESSMHVKQPKDVIDDLHTVENNTSGPSKTGCSYQQWIHSIMQAENWRYVPQKFPRIAF